VERGTASKMGFPQAHWRLYEYPQQHCIRALTVQSHRLVATKNHQILITRQRYLRATTPPDRFVPIERRPIGLRVSNLGVSATDSKRAMRHRRVEWKPHKSFFSVSPVARLRPIRFIAIIKSMPLPRALIESRWQPTCFSLQPPHRALSPLL